MKNKIIDYDKLYKEWSGVSHLDNSNKETHDSSEATDFASYCVDQILSNEPEAMEVWSEDFSHIDSDLPSPPTEDNKAVQMGAEKWLKEIGYPANDMTELTKTGIKTDKKKLAKLLNQFASQPEQGGQDKGAEELRKLCNDGIKEVKKLKPDSHISAQRPHIIHIFNKIMNQFASSTSLPQPDKEWVSVEELELKISYLADAVSRNVESHLKEAREECNRDNCQSWHVISKVTAQNAIKEFESKLSDFLNQFASKADSDKGAEELPKQINVEMILPPDFKDVEIKHYLNLESFIAINPDSKRIVARVLRNKNQKVNWGIEYHHD